MPASGSWATRDSAPVRGSPRTAPRRSGRNWLADARVLASDSGPTATGPPTRPPTGAQVDADEETVRAYTTRGLLVHEWRKFLFRDPGLPRALLPADWPGDEAAAYFDTHATRLLPSAARFVDTCLAHDGGPS
jgi:phenylacetic acid degradation operon negative regulatory protein